MAFDSLSRRIPRKKFLQLGILLLFAASSPGQGDAQEAPEMRIASELACSACRIEMAVLAEIGDADGPGQVQEQGGLLMDRRGRVFFVSPQNRGTIQVFDEGGAFVQSFGSYGEGPGEFRRISAVLFDTSDRLAVFDVLQNRVTHLGPDFEVEATNPLPPYFFNLTGSIRRLADGRVLVPAIVRSPDLFGYPLHLLSPDGSQILRSFGGGNETVPLGGTIALDRVTSYEGRDGTFWTSQVSRYRLERWDAEGRLIQILEREAEWFQPWERAAGIARERPPPPSVRGIQEDAEGRLWVLIWVAASDWKPLPPAAVTEGGGTVTSAHQTMQLHDTIIEVIDPASGILVTERRIPGVFGFAGPGVIYTYSAGELEDPRFRLLQLRLTPGDHGGER